MASSEFFEDGWKAGRGQFISELKYCKNDVSMQKEWGKYARSVVCKLSTTEVRERAEENWKEGYAAGYKYLADIGARGDWPEYVRIAPEPSAGTSYEYPASFADSDAEPETKKYSPLTPMSSDDEGDPQPLAIAKKPHPKPKKPPRHVQRRRTDHYNLKDYVFVKWADRFGARERRNQEPVVTYLDAVSAKVTGGRNYKAGPHDARIICPVPGCKRVYEQLSFIERHIDGFQHNGDENHTVFANSPLYRDNRRYPPLVAKPCRFCGWKSQTKREDPMRRHEKALHPVEYAASPRFTPRRPRP